MITRSLLAKAFPDNPRLRAELESAVALVDAIQDQATSLKAQLDAVAADLGVGEFQSASAILSAISGLPNKQGAVELTGGDAANVRPIDGADPASLVSRGAAYAILVGIGGKGTTAARPTVPSNAAAIYFDTTLAAGGKPIFNYHGTGWVDSSGTAV